MTTTLTCYSRSQVVKAESEGEFVDLGQAHAAGHGHHLARRANTSAPASAPTTPQQ